MIVETIDPILEQALLNHIVTHENGTSWEVSTCRFPYTYESGYEQVMLRNVLFQIPGHYETMIFKREGGKRVSALDYGHMRYENEEEARRHHNLILELICNNKIHPKESEMNDVNTWVSPWIERALRSSWQPAEGGRINGI